MNRQTFNIYQLTDQREKNLWSECVFIDVTEIAGNNNAFGIKIYPNPTKGILNIYFGSDLNNVNIVIENTIGQKVYESKSNQVKGTVLSIDLEKYSNGFYFIKINNHIIA